nr:hypothetical protein [Tanacetum cinerariifolium]
GRYKRFLRLAGFLRAAASTEEVQAKNFQWGLRRSTLNHLMYMSYTDVARVANAARNYEILHERDDDDTERPDKWQKSGDRHQPTSQQSSHRNHVTTTTTLAVTTGVPVIDVTRGIGVSSPTDMPILVLNNTQESIVELLVKEKLKKDKIETKRDKNGKHGEAGKSLKQLQ